MARGAKFGLVMMVLSALAYGTSDVGVKALGENLSPWQTASGRALMGLAVALIMGRMNVRSLLIPDWPWQAAIGLSSGLGFISMLFAIKLLPISVALPMIYLYPALAAMISPAVNREKPTTFDWLAIAVAITGVMLLGYGAIGDESAGGTSWAGMAWGLASAFWMALMINLTRRQAKARPTYIILFYLFAVNLLICLPVMLWMGGPYMPPPKDAASLFLFIAPVSILALLVMAVAYKYLSAHHGGVILTLEAVFSALFGIIFLKEPLPVSVALGGLMMIASSVMVSLAARPRNVPPATTSA